MVPQHFFIFNPAAGRRSAYAELKKQLDALGHVPYTLFITDAPGDAKRYVQEICQQVPGVLRFYSCGGDGTLGEVAGAIQGYPNAAVGVWPRGSGNDYVKCFGGAQRFHRIEDQIAAPTRLVDLIRVGERAAINVVNIGLEAHAASTMLRFRHHPVLGGRKAYLIGVLSAVIKHMKTGCTIIADGQLLHEGPLLTASFASGRYVGGGFQCAAHAVVDDGIMEVSAILPMARAQLAKWLPVYKKGEHLDDPAFAPYLQKTSARRVQIRCQQETTLCLDGEIITGKDFDLQLIPRAVRFIMPGQP